MEKTVLKRETIFLMFFIFLEIAVLLALIYTIIYCHCFKISPTITEALLTFGVHLVYSSVAVALLSGLFYCYCYSKKQIKELEQQAKKQLKISKFKTEKMICEVNGICGK